jgi:hypothetical protein
VYARATTTITVFRGQGADEWGDDVDNNTVVASGIRASIAEQKIYSMAEVTLQPRNLRYARMRVTKGTDIQTNDRIYDERLAQTWTIINISPYQNPVVGQDLRVDLQFVG